MQMKLVIENLEDFNVFSKDSPLICCKSISSWIVDYYFTNIHFNQIEISKNIIGFHDMFMIYQRIQSSTSEIEFFDLCKNKLKQIKNEFLLENYSNYLNRCGLIDIIDIFHQCQLESFSNTMILSIHSVQNEIDRLFFEHLLELSSSSCGIYDVKTKLTTTETTENLLKLIDHGKIFVTRSSKNSIKHTICTYLSLLLDTRNEHALIHCLTTSIHSGMKWETMAELRRLTKLPKNECLTIYQILLSFRRRKQLILNGISLSSQQDLNIDDESFQILDKYYINIKEFFDFIEQLQMIIEENEDLKIESTTTLRKLLDLISKQLHKTNQCDLIMEEIIEEVCQDFQTTVPLINDTSPNQSALSGGILTDRRFLRSVAYLCAKQTIGLPVFFENNDRPSTSLEKTSYSCLSRSPLTSSPVTIDQVTDEPVEEKTVNLSAESSSSNENQYQQRANHRCLDLSTIHETSFESDSIVIIDHPTMSDDKIPSQSIVKRQPLRVIDVNSFNNEDRQIENEKNHHENPIVFTLVSDGDKENLPVTIKKRSIASTTIEPPCKKQKKVNVKSSEVITSVFQ